MFSKYGTEIVIFSFILAFGWFSGSFFAGMNNVEAIETGNYSKHHEFYESNFIMYGSSSCPACNEAKIYLDERGTNYKFVEIQNNDVDLFNSLNKKSIPVFIIRDKQVTGYSEKLLEKILSD